METIMKNTATDTKVVVERGFYFLGGHKLTKTELFALVKESVTDEG